MNAILPRAAQQATPVPASASASPARPRWYLPQQLEHRTARAHAVVPTPGRITSEAQPHSTSDRQSRSGASTYSSASAPKRTPFAKVLRSLVSSIAATISARSVLLRRPPSGPIGALLLGASAVYLVFQALRRAVRLIYNFARGCKSCHGFGIERCNMCEGAGMVRWDAKWVHTDPCPKCAGMRYCRCEDCGGHVRRRIFNHVPRNAALEDGDGAFGSLDVLDKYAD